MVACVRCGMHARNGARCTLRRVPVRWRAAMGAVSTDNVPRDSGVVSRARVGVVLF